MQSPYHYQWIQHVKLIHSLIHNVMCCDPHFFPWILVLVDCCCESRLPFCLNLCLRQRGWMPKIHRSPCWDSFVQWSRFRKQVQSKNIIPGLLKQKCSTKIQLFLWPLCDRHHRHHQRLMGSRDLQICPCNQWASAAVSHEWHKRHRNNMTLNSKTTSVKKRLEAQAVLRFWKKFLCQSRCQMTSSHMTYFCQQDVKWLQKNMRKKPMHCLFLSPWRAGCSDPPKRLWSRGSGQMATGPPGGNISRICSMVNQPNLAKWSMQIALEVGNDMKSTWFHDWLHMIPFLAQPSFSYRPLVLTVGWQSRCPHLNSFKYKYSWRMMSP